MDEEEEIKGFSMSDSDADDDEPLDAPEDLDFGGLDEEDPDKDS